MGKKHQGDPENTLPKEFADRHRLYQWSVQVPQFEAEFMDEVFHKMRGRHPQTLREDFCGTGLLCAEWAKTGANHHAVGLDLDDETLEWGLKHNIAPLGKAAERVEMRKADVRTPTTPVSDVACAYNFSWFLLPTMNELVDYFRTVRRSLADDGLLFLDCYGGWEAQQEVAEPRLVESPHGMFTYTWEQADYDPINNIATCHIHFELAEGKRLKRAFTYVWRLYTLAEAKEALLAAGFSDCIIYWDKSPDPEVDRYRPATKAENQPGWLAYIVGVV